MPADDVDLEGSQPASGPPPGASALSAESTPFELDLDSDAPGTRGALASGEQPAPAARSALSSERAAPPDPLSGLPPAALERLTAAERRAERAEQAVAPYLAAMHQQALGQQQQISPEALRQKLNDPNATTADLVAWVNAQTQHTAMQQHQLMELTARRASSEQNVRGLTEGFEGRTFDQQRSAWTGPVLERLPYLRDVFVALNPENPALIEYGFAALLEISAQAKDDPRQFYTNLYQLLDGKLDDTGAKIQRAARAQAVGVRSARSTGRQTQSGTRATRVDADAIKDMSEGDFERLDRQLTGGI